MVTRNQVEEFTSERSNKPHALIWETVWKVWSLFWCPIWENKSIMAYMNAVRATVKNLTKPKTKLNALMLKKPVSYTRKDKQWKKTPDSSVPEVSGRVFVKSDWHLWLPCLQLFLISLPDGRYGLVLCTSSYITFHSCFYKLFWIKYFCLWNVRRCCHSLLGWAFLLLFGFFWNLYESLVETSALWFWWSGRFVLTLLMEMCLSCPNLINNSLAVLVIVLDSPRL